MKENKSSSPSRIDIQLALNRLQNTDEISVIKLMRELEEENERLRRMYTQLSLDFQSLKDTLNEGW